MEILYILLGLVALFFAVILIRAMLFKPQKAGAVDTAPVEFEKAAAVDALAELIKCRTISYNDPALEDDGEFQKLIGLLPKLYPHVFETCEFSQLPHRALLLRWPGKTAGKPAVMMAHYDVVPVDEAHWDKAPFDAVLEGDVLWGRGTLDTKGTFNGALFAADTLIAQGFQPEQDVYFAFSGGEEVNGKGAPTIVEYFKEKGLEPSLVVDEGGAVVENVFPGVKKPCALIGIGEKGMINAQYKAVSRGGHASSPPAVTPIGQLTKAAQRVLKNPFPMHITPPVGLMFDRLGRHSSFLYRLIFANLWCFSWVLDLLGKLQGGEMNALLRTTTAFTQMQGSSARNVIPPEATLVANMRLNPADSVEGALEYLRSTVKDEAVEITALESSEPSRVSTTRSEGWEKVCAAVSGTWPEAIVSPYLMIQCSDSRHWGCISDKVYRFSAMDLTAEERKTIHGHNERVRLECIHRAVEFYIRLLRQL